MRIRRLACLTIVAGACAIGAAPAAGAITPAASISGAGSTVLAPLIAEWSQVFPSFYDVNISYTAIGEAGGVSELAAGTVDFAATDSPLTVSQRQACPRCGQIPVALTAVGVGYHLGGTGGRLRLSPGVLAAIYLGRITRWNDRRIAALNPALRLPALKITPVSTSASGATDVFTQYLSAVSSTWRTKVGSGMGVSFPVGATTTSNAGVIAALTTINGSIGYAGAAYLISHHLPAAALQNAAGNYEYPNLGNIRAAAAPVHRVPADGGLRIVAPPRSAATAYPLSTFCYLVVSTTADAAHKQALADWLSFAVNGGQRFGQSLDFVPLPEVVVGADQRAVQAYAATG